MPLFSYECIKCQIVIEKFHHKINEMPKLTCECGNTEFVKLFNKWNNRTSLDAKEFLKQKIRPDADRISKNINKGKDKDFFDIHGEK